jgi:hypothetical protein
LPKLVDWSTFWKRALAIEPNLVGDVEHVPLEFERTPVVVRHGPGLAETQVRAGIAISPNSTPWTVNELVTLFNY